MNILTPPLFDDEDQTLIAHHLFIIVWTFMAVGWLALFIAAIIPETVYRWLLVVGIIESAGLILLVLNKRGYTRLVSHFMIFMIWAMATGMALTGGGTSSNAMAIYFIIVLIAGLVQSGKAGVITAILCSLTGLFLVYLDYRGSLPVNRVPHTPLTQWIANTIYMAIIICLQYLVSRTIKKSLKQAHQELKERQRVNAELRESEEKYRLLFDYSPLGHVYFDENGVIVACNDNFVRIIGSSPEALIGLNMLNLPDKKVVSAIQKVLNGGIAIYEDLYHSVTSEKITPARVLFAPIDIGNGRILGGVGIIEDITERNRTEEERRNLEGRLQRAEKMEAVGQLAGGVAHDLNNILGALTGYSELLLMEIPEGHRSRGHVEKILQSTEKGAAIIQDLLTLARRGVVASDVINLNSIVSSFIKSPVFEKMKDYHPRVIFRVECDRNLLNIMGSPVHLEKTLMNLVSNAAESISGPGEVTIRTQNRYLDQTIQGYDEVKDGDYAVLTVSDTGIGIPAENREKIFEPFYTKKTMGRSGTGLGLTIVWGTVKDHNGYIDLQTEVGKGTTFTLYFPVTRETLIAPQQKEPMEQYMGKGESVLVVDDIAEQRDIASGLLTQLGYKVHVVSSGEEAVEYLKRNKADILVLDMIMAPGIDGLETYQKVLKINPKQKAILVSGFSETDRVREAQRLGTGVYVKKPYSMEKIGIAVRDELKR